MMSSRAKRVWWSRLVAGLLCLCMMVSGIGWNNVMAAYDVDVTDTKMHVLVYHWHTIQETPDEEETVLAINQKLPDEKGEKKITVTPDAREGEEFSTFSISSGQDAVQLNSDGTEATITYSPDVHLVKVHVFYTSTMGRVAGVNFEEKEGENFGKDANPEIDTYESEGTKYYNTAKGLHTDKTAKVSELESEYYTGEDKTGPRTFDVKLESWTADANLAQVGLILDASGSMAFTSDLNEDNRIRVNEKMLGVSDTDVIKVENGARWLSQEQVDKILNKNYTSNSLLDYSDYSYFVYDTRGTVLEYAPLGYWDGTGFDYDPLNEGLTGYYSFDDTLKNGAPGKGEEDIAESIDDENKEKDPGYSSSGGGIRGDSIKLYNKNSGGKERNIRLDSEITNLQNFTVSFAVKTNVKDKVIHDSDASTWDNQNILYIGASNMNTEDEIFSLVRGSRSDGDNDSRLRGYMGDDNRVINISSIFNSTDWHIITCVVGDSKCQVYIDGEERDECSFGWPGTINGKASVILGGLTQGVYHGSADLYMDEVYVYDRALGSSEVSSLVKKSKGESSESTDERDYYVAMKDNKKIIAGVHDKTAEAFVEESITEKERSGWYYVNSTSSNLPKKLVAPLHTSKELRGVPKKASSPEYQFDEDKSSDLEKVKELHKGAEPPTQKTDDQLDFTETYKHFEKSRAIQFYLDSNNYLCCVYSPTNNKYSYSYVYYKPDTDTIKREKLQEAIGSFVNELKQDSPESQVAAVRFSTDADFSNPKIEDFLTLLKWTNDPKKSAAILNLGYGDGTALDGTDGQYNYLMTGGTYVTEGLKTFLAQLLDENLDPNLTEGSEIGEKYLIIFTDGVDDSIKDLEETTIEGLSAEDNDAIKITKDLKEKGWTIYSIMLPSDGQQLLGKAQAFLTKLSGTNNPEDNNADYVKDAKGGLQQTFANISGDVIYNLSHYTVQDYIDPRFDLIAQVEGQGTSKKLIHLNAEGIITFEALPRESLTDIDVVPADFKTNGLRLVVTGSDEAQNATLCWDDKKGMYYLQWTDQIIPGCSVGSTQLRVWNSTITLRAKEDFIGGNAVLTNGEDKLMNYVYDPDDESASSGINDASIDGENTNPSKGFPRVTVNVGLLPRDTESEQVIYLGEKIEPLKIAKSLMDELKSDDAGTEGSHYYWEYLERYARKNRDGELDELLKELILGSTTSTSMMITASSEGEAVVGTVEADTSANGQTAEIDSVLMDEIIEEPVDTGIAASLETVASTGTPLKIPYSYLPAVPKDGMDDTVTQTGGEVHEEDVLGMLTYTWEEASGIQTGKGETAETDGAYVTKDTTTRKYILQVKYEPFPESNASVEAIDDEIDLVDTSGGALMDRDAANTKLLGGEEAYQWTKPAVGNVITGPITSTGTHTTKIVRGELALKVSAKKSFLNVWFSNHTELAVTVNATREYEKDGITTPMEPEIEPLTVTIRKADYEAAVVAGGEPGDTISFFTYYTDPKASDVADEHHPYTTENPQALPIGTYTLKLKENSLFKTLKYASDSDYDGHFTVEEFVPGDLEDPTDGAINVPDATDDKTDEEGITIKQIGKAGSSKDATSGYIKFSNYIAPKTDKEDTPATIGFYLGTESTEAGAPSSTRTPNGPYLDTRLGMVEVDLETGSLTVEKKVTGEAGEKNKKFHFVVTLKNGEEVATEITGKYGNMTFNEGIAKFDLEDSQSLKAEYLPVGLTYEVTEMTNAGYTATGKVESESAAISTVTPAAIDADEAESNGLEVVSGVPEDAPSSTDSTESTVVGEDENTTGDTDPGTLSVVGESENTTGDTDLGTPSMIGEDEDTSNGTDPGTPAAISADEGMPGNTSLIAPIASGVGEPLATDHPKSVSGKILSDEEPSGGVIVSFTNDRKPATANLTVTKNLNVDETSVGALEGMPFSFVLTPNEGNPPEDPVSEEGIKNTVKIASTGSSGTSTLLTAVTDNFFKDLKFKQLGIYTYTLREEVEDISGIIYDDTKYTVTVTVKEGEDKEEGKSWGDLRAEVSVTKEGEEESEPDTSGEVTFTNSYVTGNLTVRKTVLGEKGDKTKGFNFTVTLYKDSKTVATEVNGTYSDSNGMEFIDGVAKFTLKNGESKTATGLPAGLRYTVTEAEANTEGYGTVATGNGEGTIPEGGTATVEFTNTKPAASIILEGSKTYYVGETKPDLTEGQFTFELKAIGSNLEGIDVPMPADYSRNDDGTLTATTTNKADGSFEFGGISYSELGTYYYTITEKKPSKPEEGESSVIYDTTVYDVTVTVRNGSDGNYEATAVYTPHGDSELDGSEPGEADFTNFTPVKSASTLDESTTVKPGDELTYEITWMNPGKNPADIIITDVLDSGVDYKSAKAGEVEGGKVTYDNSSRTVTWELGEQEGRASGTVTLTVEVNESAVSKIENSATVKVGDQSAVTNKVENPVENPDAVLPVDVTLHVEKSLTSAEGIDLPEKSYGFTFELRAADANPDADPLKKMLLGTSPGEDVDSTTGTESVTVTVGPTTWTAEEELAELTYTEAGTYQYEVRETFGSDSEGTYAGITYDGTVHTVTVTVKETTDAATGDRVLKAQIAIDGESVETIDLPATVKFTNTYKKDQVNVVLQGHKVLENGTLESGQFTFELRPVSAEVEEETTPALANIAMIGEELDDVVEPDGQMPQTDLAEQGEPTSQADGEMQSETTLQTDLTEQGEPTPQTDGEVQSELTPLTEAAEQGGLTSQTDGEVQSESTPQAEAVEQSEQAPQTEAVEQSEQTPLTEAAEQGDMTSPAGAEAQSDPSIEADASMMKRSASMKGGQSFLGTARLGGGSFLGTAPVSSGRSFSGAASVRRRSVVRSAPAMLSDDIIVEPVDESSLEPAAESAQEPIPEMDVNLDEMDVFEEESEIEQGSEAETTPEAEWMDPAAEDTGDIVPQIADDTVVDADFDVVIEEEEPVDLEQNDVQEEEIIDISDDESLEVTEGGVDAGTDDDFAGSEESSLENDTDTVEESETEEILELDQTIEMIGEPVKITSVPDTDEADGIDGLNEISEPTTKIINLDAGRVPMPAGTKDGVAIATNSGSGTFDFGSIVYDKPGEYHYTITERVDNTVNNVEFDMTSYDVTVVVEQNGSDELFVKSVEYLPKVEGVTSGAPRSQAEFTNMWKEPETEPTETDPPQTEQSESNPPQTEQTETNPPQTDPPQTETNPPSVGSLTVTKVNRDATTNETIVLTDAQFYVALFADSTLTQRVGDVKTLSFPGNASSASATFSNLPAGTYYVAETNTSGTPMSGGEYSGGVYSARYANGQQVTIAGNGSSAAFSFENVFSTLPDLQHYKNIKELIITKNVTDGAGAAMQTNEVFYAGIFADAGYTQLAGHVSRNIVPFEMGGNSSASATVQVMVPSEGVTQLYVTEVDANGAPVTNSGSFPYKVSVVGGSLSLNINSGSQSVTITNTANEETEEETETETEITEEEFESEGAGSGGVGSGATAAKTGDETPIEKMLLLMAISLAMTLLIGSRSRRKKML